MGLGSVELVMTVEETFAITIDDRDAEKIQTIGALHRYVLGRLAGKAISVCPSASGFYRVRQGLIEGWSVARRTIRPGTRIEDLMPSSRRYTAWRGLGEVVGLELPGLLLPRWCGWLAGWLYLASVTGLVAAWLRFVGPNQDMVVFVGIAAYGLMVGGTILWIRLQFLFGTILPTRYETVGDIARWIGTSHYTNIDPDRLSREVYDTLLEIVAEASGIGRDQLHAETSFVHDLGY